MNFNMKINISRILSLSYYCFLKFFIQIEWEMRRKNRKQKKVVVQAGKSKTGFDAEDEEEDVSKVLALGKHAHIQIFYIKLLMVAE